MTLGSLFAGIGGFDLGFERAGFKTVWQVEIDEYCRKVLAKHFPDADRSVTDVRQAGKHNLKPVDVICGGFPCQDISSAGKRFGISGSQSSLWGEMLRVLCELRPRFSVIENVAALLDRGMERVICDLSENGFDAEWKVLSACRFGAPHLRERMFIVAYSPSEWRRRECGGIGREIISDTKRDLHIWGNEPPVPRVAYGLPNRMDRLHALGNSVVPQIAQWIAERIKKVAEPESEE